jgi:triacylglycerol esterase/lipase EstA (alpha/beta hydrolase family)
VRFGGKRLIVGVAMATALAAGVGVVASEAASASALPVSYNGLNGFVGHLLTPTTPAPGSILVDWRARGLPAPCTSATHPLPVVLVNGTVENQAMNWWAISPLLKNNGYCVYTANVGGPSATWPLQTVGDIPTTAGQLGTVIDKVLAATGAKKVDLVGHSQGGGVMPRWYLKYDDGAAKVDKLIGLSPSNHGTTLSGIQTLGKFLGILDLANALLNTAAGPAWAQQELGSSVNTQLDAGGDTVPGVEYTTIVTKNDEVVTPYTNQFLVAGPGAVVHNELLQAYCGWDFSEHLATPYDHIAAQLVLNALDPAQFRQPSCSFVAPIVGG